MRTGKSFNQPPPNFPCVCPWVLLYIHDAAALDSEKDVEDRYLRLRRSVMRSLGWRSLRGRGRHRQILNSIISVMRTGGRRSHRPGIVSDDALRLCMWWVEHLRAEGIYSIESLDKHVGPTLSDREKHALSSCPADPLEKLRLAFREIRPVIRNERQSARSMAVRALAQFADVDTAAVEKSLGKRALDPGTGYGDPRELISLGPSVPGAPRIIVDLEEFDKRRADSRNVDADGPGV